MVTPAPNPDPEPQPQESWLDDDGPATLDGLIEQTDAEATESAVEAINQGLPPDEPEEGSQLSFDGTAVPPAETSPTTPVAPSLEEQNRLLEAQIKQMESQEANRQFQAQQAQLQQAVQGRAQSFAQELVQEGYGEQEAQGIAHALGENYILKYQQAIQQNAQAKQQLAQQYGTQFGVPAERLMAFDTPQSMQEGAKLLQLQMQNEQNTNQRLDNLERGNVVPPQRFDQSQRTVNTAQNEIDLMRSAVRKAPHERSDAENAAMRRAAGL